jgi:NAD+ synthase (glutamine-hydrolysing)
MMNRSPLKVTLAQINPIVGDVDGNAQKIIDITNEYTNKCDLIVFPELALSGYQPEDLFKKLKKQYKLLKIKFINQLI